MNKQPNKLACRLTLPLGSTGHGLPGWFQFFSLLCSGPPGAPPRVHCSRWPLHNGAIWPWEFLSPGGGRRTRGGVMSSGSRKFFPPSCALCKTASSNTHTYKNGNNNKKIGSTYSAIFVQILTTSCLLSFHYQLKGGERAKRKVGAPCGGLCTQGRFAMSDYVGKENIRNQSTHPGRWRGPQRGSPSSSSSVVPFHNKSNSVYVGSHANCSAMPPPIGALLLYDFANKLRMIDMRPIVL